MNQGDENVNDNVTTMTTDIAIGAVITISDMGTKGVNLVEKIKKSPIDDCNCFVNNA